MTTQNPSQKMQAQTAEQQLKTYFEQQKPGCSIHYEFKNDTRAWRFHFVEKNKNLHTLDVSEESIEDNSSEKLIAKLEHKKWQDVLKKHGTAVVRFDRNGFSAESPTG